VEAETRIGRIQVVAAALIWPDGQISRLAGDLPVQPPLQKYFCFSEIQIKLLIRCPASLEGRFAIVTDARRDAVDADVPITNGAEAYGKDVWS
jgi:hypothetical protein